MAEEARGTAAERGYDETWRRRRARGLVRFPVCQRTVDGVQCSRPGKVRDHWPESRKQLLARGVADPDDDRYLRTLCDPCNRVETAANQPGGWNAER